jgi:hypothetical protein
LAVAQHGSALSGAEPNAGLPANPMGVPLGTAEFYVSPLSVLSAPHRLHYGQNITSGSALKEEFKRLLAAYGIQEE